MKKEIIEDIEGKEKDRSTKWNRVSYVGVISLALMFPSIFVILVNLVIGIILLNICLSFSIVSAFVLFEYRKQDIIIETAIWIVRHWIEDGQLNTDFSKYTYVKFDGKYDNALSFLHENYNIDLNPRKNNDIDVS